ncbi:hypothetical protein Z517_03553 [Fonsecaea pedrosoi CBS 271.37]|uniref:Xylanolytic transcriptional activator regulatory domain-containing protein n=1 Tax=Fonsecaea pedrosoi CBS 271.37 TaxID=1442368 RepID=A0A0D2GTG9_9EURO|nr:uncharacterized protein Z517_03553 [Fonsecaea pedrosoi CBS 271.37]KIW84303.1 hypothetical protein Z517_03553 [Fonsecaea pedrosoi CBS 271.37]
MEASDITRRTRMIQQQLGLQPMEGASHILGPVVARDTHSLKQYLFGLDGQPDDDLSCPSQQGNHKSQPIYHVPIPPPRPRPAKGPRNLPKELLSQAKPYLRKLMFAFYDRLHPCYPITDEEFVVSRMRENYLPEGFLVGLLTYSTFYWDTLLGLQTETKPDHFAACQAAFSVNTEDIQKTDLWTILSLCYNLAGRPSKCLIGNISNVARIVGLSQAIGLHHDCSHWNISEIGKRIRWKAWWAVLIQDRWFHLAHGTPPHVAQEHYNVPVPTMDLLLHNKAPSTEQTRAAEVYITLCRLTEVVGDLLPLIYHVRSRADNIAVQQRAKVELRLQQWVEECPDWLNLHALLQRPTTPGFPNLQLSYFAVRMLLCQITWHQSRDGDAGNSLSLLLNCKEAAGEIVEFVQSLQIHELSGFWLPYNAHHLTAATTLLLRCGVQATTPEISTECLSSARTLVDCLQGYKTRYAWDLAESILAQNEDLLSRVDGILARRSVARTPRPPSTTTNEYIEPVDTLNAFNDPMLAEIFPELFAEFADTALYSTLGDPDLNAEFDPSILQE